MKTQKGTREHDTDEMRKAKRLEPMRKSGKDRHSIYRSMDEDEDDESLEVKPRESVRDYFDDEPE